MRHGLFCLFFGNRSEVDVFYYQQLILQAMCFIRNSCADSPALLSNEALQSGGLPSLPSKDPQAPFCPFDGLPSFNSRRGYPSPDCHLLAKLLAAVSQNSQTLARLAENIDRSSGLLQTARQSVASRPPGGFSHEGESRGEGWRAREAVIEKLFGQREYRYRLKLRSKFAGTLYKERNMALAVELVDGQEKPVMNSNLVNICLSACEGGGEWIPESAEGLYFMQGKTEVELYHGEALFQKIYPRDVSRQFANGRIAIVVYPKPSLVRFSSSASLLEERVRAEDIEPLLIRDVLIRAKKKSQ